MGISIKMRTTQIIIYREKQPNDTSVYTSIWRKLICIHNETSISEFSKSVHSTYNLSKLNSDHRDKQKKYTIIPVPTNRKSDHENWYNLSMNKTNKNYTYRDTTKTSTIKNTNIQLTTINELITTTTRNMKLTTKRQKIKIDRIFLI